MGEWKRSLLENPVVMRNKMSGDGEETSHVCLGRSRFVVLGT